LKTTIRTAAFVAICSSSSRKIVNARPSSKLPDPGPDHGKGDRAEARVVDDAHRASADARIEPSDARHSRLMPATWMMP
jgi:hypothetical protein